MNVHRKPRVLILSAVVPKEGSGGGCLTMHRHFVLNTDFETAVAAERGDLPANMLVHQIRLGRLSQRARRTRFFRPVMNSEYLRNWCLLPKSLLEFARAFKPDIIFSVVDDWHMGLAWQLSGS